METNIEGVLVESAGPVVERLQTMGPNRRGLHQACFAPLSPNPLGWNCSSSHEEISCYSGRGTSRCGQRMTAASGDVESTSAPGWICEPLSPALPEESVGVTVLPM